LKTSKKVKELIKILNEIKDDNPKIIIFVKDRVVAEYLKRLLLKHVELSRKGRKVDHPDELLDHFYKIDMAMGPQGKNMVNKALKFTKKPNEFHQELSTDASVNTSFSDSVR
jgi:hypothetical protein